MATAPDPQMLAAIEEVARFLETGDARHLAAFARERVSIVENFPPYVFDGPDAVARWADGMRAHLRTTSRLTHRFGEVQTFSANGDLAYLSVPTRWTGEVDGRAFEEDGGWAFVLVKEGAAWRVRGYGWAVTRVQFQPTQPSRRC